VRGLLCFGREDLLSWSQRLGLPEPTRLAIDHIRSSGPSRRVGGGSSNVCGRYPSKKMGVTIQFESHRVELAGIYEMEHDPSVLEYFDQPPPIKLTYESPTGRKMGVWHTPDFFVIRDREAGWEEWKTEEGLQRLKDRNPNRYFPKPKEQGGWDCPPGVAYAAPLGLYYHVRSSAEIDWTFQRNIQFLDDYLRADPSTIPASSRETARAHISAVPGLCLDKLLQVTKASISADDIFGMIAANILYVNLHAAPLAEPSRVEVYSSQEAATVAKPYNAGTPQLLSPVKLTRWASRGVLFPLCHLAAQAPNFRDFAGIRPSCTRGSEPSQPTTNDGTWPADRLCRGVPNTPYGAR